MTLENTFYIVGIATMSLYLVFLLAVLITLIKIRNRILMLFRNIEKRFKEFKTIADLGASVADSAINKASEIFEDRKKKRRR